jgi:hypothetical protein
MKLPIPAEFSWNSSARFRVMLPTTNGPHSLKNTASVPSDNSKARSCDPSGEVSAAPFVYVNVTGAASPLVIVTELGGIASKLVSVPRRPRLCPAESEPNFTQMKLPPPTFAIA